MSEKDSSLRLHVVPSGHGCCAHHHHAADETLAAADALCRAKGLRLTEQRRAVLEALAESAHPCGAYDLIEALRAKKGRAFAPIAIYRALDFLKENGLIHRLESLNAFIACPHRHADEEGIVFLICEICHHVEETIAAPLNQALRNVAQIHDFKPRHQVVEISGLCSACRQNSENLVP